MIGERNGTEEGEQISKRRMGRMELKKGREEEGKRKRKRTEDDVYSPPKRDEREDRLGEDRSERNRTEEEYK
jgi:hypothetical protein